MRSFPCGCALILLSSYYVNEDTFNSEKNVARQYAGQKVWPRAVYVRRARYVRTPVRDALHVFNACLCRYFHSGRLRWNSLERLRGPLEDSLIDDLVEWSVWHYAGIREYVVCINRSSWWIHIVFRTSQALLENMTGVSAF